MGTENKAMAGWRFSAEGEIAAACRDGFSRSVGGRCQTLAQALPRPPRPCARVQQGLQERGSDRSPHPLLLPPAPWCCSPTESKAVHPAGGRLSLPSPRAAPPAPALAFPPPSLRPVPAAVDRSGGTRRSLIPPCIPPGQPSSPWRCPTSRSAPALAAPLFPLVRF